MMQLSIIQKSDYPTKPSFKRYKIVFNGLKSAPTGALFLCLLLKNSPKVLNLI
jgi:hypothetical protein